jgi:single-strand DNA-binding protein
MRTINKVILIGNVTRDPELRYTESGKGVATFGLATNRQWTSEEGEKREETDFHRITAWGKLGELCDKYLKKGRKVYLEGQLRSRSYKDSEGVQRAITEIVLDDMVMLDSKPQEKQTEETKSQETTHAQS